MAKSVTRMLADFYISLQFGSNLADSINVIVYVAFSVHSFETRLNLIRLIKSYGAEPAH